MPDMNLITDVFSPHYVKTLRFEGDHPSRTLKLLPFLMRMTFRITSTNFYEDDIKWDVSAEPVEFFGEWRGVSGIDERTKFWIKTKVIGKQNSEDKKGYATIYIHPYMKTKIPYSSTLDKFLAPIYSRLFYRGQIKRYIERKLYFCQKFEDDLKKELGLGR